VHAAVLLLAALAAAAPGPRLAAPVDGAITEGFSYAGDPFAPGHHRGVDLAAAPGAPVRAACAGRVTFAARAGANGVAVTVRCGAWSVTHLPLRRAAVRAGEHVLPGARIGDAGASRGHAGLHLGVRRATDRLGYVDPAPLLGHVRPAPPPPGGAPRRPAPPPPRPAPLPSRPVSRPGSSPAARPVRRPVAPWPVWAGLALLLSGAIGAGTVRAARKRRAPLPRAVAREVP